MSPVTPQQAQQGYFDPSQGLPPKQGQPTAEDIALTHPADRTVTPDNHMERLVGITKLHPWMPLQTAATLAASPASDQMVASMAGAMRQTWGSTNNVLHYITDDPLLQKEPSLALRFRQYATGTIGPWPIADSDVKNIQQYLLKNGFAKAAGTNWSTANLSGAPKQPMKVDGVWSEDWNSAYNLYLQQLKTDQLGGSQPGSVPFGKAVGWTNDLLPKESASSIIGWIQALPGDARNDLRTLAGHMGAIGSDIGSSFVSAIHGHGGQALEQFGGAAAQGSVGQQPQTSTSEESASARAENLLSPLGGGHVTPEQSYAAQGARAQGAAMAQALGDLLVLHGIMGAGGTVARAAGETSLKDFSLAEAQRGPGTIAKTFLRTPAEGEAATGIFTNPILKFTGPVADNIIGENGLYYRARSLLATPYAYGPIRVAGTAVGQAGIAGAKARGVANLESMIAGSPSNAQQKIDNYHGLDGIDNAIANKLSFSIDGIHFRNGIDTLAWFLHPPLSGPHSVSNAIGKDVGAAHGALNRSLGPDTGYAVNIERALNMVNHKDGPIKLEDLIDNVGGEANFAKMMIPKMWQYAASHYAEMQFKDASPEEVSAYGGRDEFIQAMIDKAWNDDALLRRAAEEMKVNNSLTAGWGGTDEVSRRMAKEILYTRNGRRGWIADNGLNAIQSGDIMRGVILPRIAEILGSEELTPGSLGLANLDYPIRQAAVQYVSGIEERYQEAQKLIADTNAPVAERRAAWLSMSGMADELREWLTKNWQIAEVPGDLQDLMALARRKAEGQAAAAVYRSKNTFSAPVRPEPDLAQGDLGAPDQLSNRVSTPVYRGSTAQDALNTLFGEGQGALNKEWVSRVPTAPDRVMIEADPSKLFGGAVDQTTGFDIVRKAVRFQAARAGLAHDLDGIRVVDIRNGSPDNSVQALTRKLVAAGFVGVKRDNMTQFVHPEHAVGLPKASDATRQAFADLHSLGKQVVIGRNIGQDFMEHPFLDVLNGKLTWQRRLVEKAGLSPENIPTADYSFWVPVAIEREIQKSVDAGKLRLLPYDSASGIMKRLRQVPAKEGLASAIYTGTPLLNRGYQKRLNELTDQLLPTEGKNAKAIAAGSLRQSVENPMGMMHLKPAEVKEALGYKIDPDSAAGQHLENKGHDLSQMVAYDDAAQQEVMRAIRRAAASLPWRMTGWQGIEYMMQHGLSFGGRPLPGSLGRWVENLPSQYIRFRNQARFTLSPFFSARRLVKAIVKTSLDGVPISFRPLESLNKAGIRSEALKTLDRVMPEWANEHYDEGTQFQYANDIYNIYDFRNQEAWTAWHLQKNGLTDTEIRETLIKDFGYGSKQFGEGRTGLERSLNFTFFPISFDKTLYRNVGAYLLDRPAQRMMITAGLAAYNQFNIDHPSGDTFFTSSWWQDHLPLFKTAEYMNAFYHGVGIGELGGINAPLLNLFLPQQYNADGPGLQTLKGMIPAIREFQNLWQESGQSLKVGIGQIQMLAQHSPSGAQYGEGSVWMPAKVLNVTDAAANHDAWVYRRELENALGKDVQWNAHHKSKFKVPNDPDKFGTFAGRNVSSLMVDQMVNLKYPQFDPGLPTRLYDQAADAINQYTEQMRQEHRSDVVQWITSAQAVSKWIVDSRVSTEQSAHDTQVIRNYAIKYAETLPGFLSFYNSQFSWQFGPLTQVKQ